MPGIERIPGGDAHGTMCRKNPATTGLIRPAGPWREADGARPSRTMNRVSTVRRDPMPRGAHPAPDPLYPGEVGGAEPWRDEVRSVDSSRDTAALPPEIPPMTRRTPLPNTLDELLPPLDLLGTGHNTARPPLDTTTRTSWICCPRCSTCRWYWWPEYFLPTSRRHAACLRKRCNEGPPSRCTSPSGPVHLGG